MKTPSFLWQAAGFAFATLAGTLLHFLFDWTAGSVLVAPFSGINESTWEHMKLLFWPLFWFACFQRFFFRENPSFWCIKLIGILVGIGGIPVLFYTYNGAFGSSPDWLNIGIFYVSAAATFLLEWHLFQRCASFCHHGIRPLLGICLIGALFILFTFAPPPIPLFQAPLK